MRNALRTKDLFPQKIFELDSLHQSYVVWLWSVNFPHNSLVVAYGVKNPGTCFRNT